MGNSATDQRETDHALARRTMRVRTGLLAALSGVLLAPSPTVAQPAEPAQPADDPIVVTGQAVKPPRQEVDRQARAITGGRGDLRHSPLARIEDRLCPGVLGLRRDAAELMVDRIRWNAERLDMRLAEAGDCAPNLIVAFVDDGKAAIAELARSKSWLFESLTLPERRALLAAEGPVRVWSTTAMKTLTGMPIPRRESLDAPPVVSMNAAHSKIYINVREDITQVLVLFDRDQVYGKTVIQLADYATMRGFARTRPAEAGSALDTVLALFEPGAEPPPGLTDFDQAYLRSLYEDIPNLRGINKVLGVNSELNQLIREKAERE